MKTVKGLHEKMGTFENANTSFHQAARCKRYTNEVLAFSMVKEEELLRATEEIQNLTYRQEFNRKYESRKGHLGHADTYHIAKAVEYELLFYEWERLEATA